MKAEDVKILGQLSPETQEKIEIKLTVKELFAYAKYITEDEQPEQPEQPKQTKAVVNYKPPTKKEKPEVTAPVVQLVVPEGEAPEIQEEQGTTLYYTVKDVADTYNATKNSVYAWIKKGLLKVHHQDGRNMLFAKSDVERIKRRRGKNKTKG
ncbi:MAG: helix-turn-helix domain-containing protein [Prevotellaceae bacterium]|jgi:excisionase family DNA binding protein|nr:helix-turn-helix domain-containing protein [Prevotellaceae bacterium]